MTDEISALTAKIASMQTEIYLLREANAYPASIRWHARAEERERCAKVAITGCLVPPDGGSPEPWEVDLCDEIARRIRALGDE
jgi:hypothetical protein